MSAVATLPPDGDRPVSDDERERVVAVLKGACGQGRLTLDEFSERVGTAYGARTAADLALAAADLPGLYPEPAPVQWPAPTGPPSMPAPAPAGWPAPRAGREPTRWIVGIMSGSHRKGRFRLREQTNALAIMGGCVLDLRNAEVEGAEVVINAIAVMGGIDIIVPEGIEVDLSGIAIMGGKDASRVRADVPLLPGAPLIRVRAFAFWGGVSVRSKPLTGREQRRLGRDQRREQVRDIRDQRRAARRGGWPPGPPEVPAPPAMPEAPAPHRMIDEMATGQADAGESLWSNAAPGGTVTIMFSDIEGFTSLIERLGDRAAMEVLHEHNDIVRGQVAVWGGYEVKAQGDGFMLAFSGVHKGLHCAVGIQRALAARNRQRPDIPVQVRLGLHTGEAIREGSDFVGGAVVLAARITQQAKGGQVLVSSVLKDLCDLSGEFQFGDGQDVFLKGLSESRRLYEVAWDDAPDREDRGS
jgi:class 3 adenylate cyclase